MSTMAMRSTGRSGHMHFRSLQAPAQRLLSNAPATQCLPARLRPSAQCDSCLPANSLAYCVCMTQPARRTGCTSVSVHVSGPQSTCSGPSSDTIQFKGARVCTTWSETCTIRACSLVEDISGLKRQDGGVDSLGERRWSLIMVGQVSGTLPLWAGNF